MTSLYLLSGSSFIISALFPSTGSDSAATDAGQVPDHVRPDHWKEYPINHLFY